MSHSIRRSWLWLFCMLGVSGSAAEPPAERARVAVLPLRPGPGVDPKTADLVTENLVAEISQRTGQRVLSSHEIEAMLGFERQRQLLGCSSDTSCLTEIGGALGVERLVSGTLGKLGGSLVFNLQLINMRTGLAERRYSNRIRGTNDEAFLDAIPSAVDDLFQKTKPSGLPMPPPPAPRLRPKPPADQTVVAPPPSSTSTAVVAVQSEVAAQPRWTAALRGQLMPLSLGTLERGGALAATVGYRLNQAMTLSAGPIGSLTSVGGLAQLSWIPFADANDFHPLVSLEVPVLVPWRKTPGAANVRSITS